MSPEEAVKLRYVKLRYTAWGVLGGVLIGLPILTPLTALGLKIDHTVKGFVHIFQKGDLPVIIAGGSIDARAVSQSWTLQTPKKEYSVILPNSGNNFVTFEGFDEKPPDLDETKSWKIRIDNRDLGGSPKIEAVKLCSNQNCDIGGTPDANGNVFLKAGNKARWKETGSSKKVLHFHDTDCDGTADNDNETSCDAIVQIMVHTAAHPGGQPYTCTGGQCDITVGMTY
jgi:hypothetical protein